MSDGVGRDALEERRRHALRDLEELAQQVDDGEIDEAEAARLEARYRADLEEVERTLATLPSAPKRPKRAVAEPEADAAGAGRNTRRTLWIMAGVLAALTVGIVIAANLGGDDQATAGGAVSTVPGQTGDLAADMEAVLESHPDSNAMRLSLAGLYFDRGEYLAAMEHYVYVLDNAPLVEEEVVALSRVGWMAYLTDQPLTAAEYLRSAIEIDPAYGEAKLFLAVVLLYGLEDPEAAVPVLEDVLALPDLPESLRPEVENMLAEAQAGVSDS